MLAALISAAAPAAAQVAPVLRIRVSEDTAEVRRTLTALRSSISGVRDGAVPAVADLERLRELGARLQASACAEELERFEWGADGDDAACLFSEGALTPVNVTFYSRGGSVFADVYSTTFFERVRVAVATMLSETDEEETGDDTDLPEVGEVREAVQRLIAGGGNALLTANWPVAFGLSEIGNSAFTVSLTGRLAVESRAFGANTGNAEVSYAGGLVGTGRLGSDDGLLQVFVGFKAESIGGDPVLREIFVDEETDALRYMEISGGVLVGDLFTITASKIALGNDLLKGAETQISITTASSLR